MNARPAQGLVPLEPDEGETHAGVPARQILAAKRRLSPPGSWIGRAEAWYIAAFALGLVGLVLWRVWAAAASLLLDIASPIQRVLGASVLLLLLLAVLRYSTWQGFVSFSEPDCMLLLTAPAQRRQFVLPRLTRIALLMAIGGAVIAVLAALAHGERAAAVFAEEAAAGFALGVVLVAASWHVQRLPRASVWVLRLTLPALALAILLALGEGAGGTLRTIVLWSGPWGWSILPLTSGAWFAGAVGALLLWLLAGAGWMSCVRTAGDCSLESFLFRARTRNRAVAGLYSFDVRTVVLTTRESRDEPWRSRLRLALPRTPWLAISWRALLSLLRSPLRLAWGVVLAGSAMLLLANASTRGLAWIGSVALYLAAGSLIESLRLEVDAPVVSLVLLPWRYGTVLLLHCLPATVIMILAGVVAILAGWAAGIVTAAAVAVLAALIVPVIAAVVLTAALSARRGGTVPTTIVTLTAGDTIGASVILILLWYFSWAILGIVSVAAAVQLVTSHGYPVQGVVTAAVLFAALALLLWRVLAASRR